MKLLLGGEIEVDENHLGGKRKGKRDRDATGQTPTIRRQIINFTKKNIISYKKIQEGVRMAKPPCPIAVVFF